jgi:hypothetical protein
MKSILMLVYINFLAWKVVNNKGLKYDKDSTNKFEFFGMENIDKSVEINVRQEKMYSKMLCGMNPQLQIATIELRKKLDLKLSSSHIEIIKDTNLQEYPEKNLGFLCDEQSPRQKNCSSDAQSACTVLEI